MRLASGLAALFAASACHHRPDVPQISVADAASLLATGAAIAVDTNSDVYREQHGVIPNAVLLATFSQYDPWLLRQDPPRKLVFYCSVRMCSASKTAALRALWYGIDDVAVLTLGLQGWKAAGYATERRRSTSRDPRRRR